MNKKEKNNLVPESNNNSNTNKLINSSFFPHYEEEELKSIQRSIALLKQDLPKIINDELIKFLNNRQGRRF